MCETCGCNNNDFRIIDINQNNTHDHLHSHGKAIVNIETPLLAKNDLIAENNRAYFLERKIKVFNLVSSPGSGKTSLLELLIKKLNQSRKIYVIEGDQQTDEDAKRIRLAGADAVQINTGNGCHLDSHMIAHAVASLNPENGSILFIENVGNLVCPALFDLGESLRIVVASTTEGEDKPLKYATMFQRAHICILNKTDLQPYLDFSIEKFRKNLNMVNHDLPLLLLSAKTGDGVDELISIILQ